MSSAVMDDDDASVAADAVFAGVDANPRGARDGAAAGGERREGVAGAGKPAFCCANDDARGGAPIARWDARAATTTPTPTPRRASDRATAPLARRIVKAFTIVRTRSRPRACVVRSARGGVTSRGAVPS